MAQVKGMDTLCNKVLQTGSKKTDVNERTRWNKKIREGG